MLLWWRRQVFGPPVGNAGRLRLLRLVCQDAFENVFHILAVHILGSPSTESPTIVSRLMCSLNNMPVNSSLGCSWWVTILFCNNCGDC